MALMGKKEEDEGTEHVNTEEPAVFVIRRRRSF